MRISRLCKLCSGTSRGLYRAPSDVSVYARAAQHVDWKLADTRYRHKASRPYESAHASAVYRHRRRPSSSTGSHKDALPYECAHESAASCESRRFCRTRGRETVSPARLCCANDDDWKGCAHRETLRGTPRTPPTCRDARPCGASGGLCCENSYHTLSTSDTSHANDPRRALSGLCDRDTPCRTARMSLAWARAGGECADAVWWPVPRRSWYHTRHTCKSSNII